MCLCRLGRRGSSSISCSTRSKLVKFRVWHSASQASSLSDLPNKLVLETNKPRLLSPPSGGVSLRGIRGSRLSKALPSGMNR
uniref:Uncharacterized protein n=1 Tax=Picea glauca TaxID=3330 RepID=A0A101M365_PICGL|nr:hypothetical protein ABT39_MTgene67 [Picea glauca]QHR90766.1 hypothetical protein Q903MT_gene4792 [Picea sitchensis]